MNIEFTETAWEDLNYWIDNDPSVLQRIIDLIKSIKRTPSKGLGKPERLKYEFKGCWSRRINREHRLVYLVKGSRNEGQRCVILQCRYHYEG